MVNKTPYMPHELDLHPDMERIRATVALAVAELEEKVGSLEMDLESVGDDKDADIERLKEDLKEHKESREALKNNIKELIEEDDHHE